MDEVKGTLRLLYVLYYDPRPITRLELLEEMKKINVGRTAAYKAIETLRSLGLITENQEVYSGKRVIVTYISEKGIAVGEKLDEIKRMLESEGE